MVSVPLRGTLFIYYDYQIMETKAKFPSPFGGHYLSTLKNQLPRWTTVSFPSPFGGHYLSTALFFSKEELCQFPSPFGGHYLSTQYHIPREEWGKTFPSPFGGHYLSTKGACTRNVDSCFRPPSGDTIYLPCRCISSIGAA